MYYVFKSIHVYSIIQKHWWSLTLSWSDEVERTFSTAHWFWRHKVNVITVIFVRLYELRNLLFSRGKMVNLY